MIDWITAEIPFRHEPLRTGVVISLDENGEEEYVVSKWRKIQGTHDTGIQVRSSGSDMFGYATHLRIHGNPAKYLQGHNVFGTDDLSSLMLQFVDNLSLILDIPLNDIDRKQIKNGEYNLSRIDINYGFRLKTRADVLTWIRAAAHKGKTKRGRAQCSADTVYFQKNSRRWAIKTYSKGTEIEQKGHHLPEALQQTDIPQFADNLLRIELTLRQTELIEINCRKAKYLTEKKLKELFNIYLKKIDMNAQITLKDEVVTNLSRTLQATYYQWKEGVDLSTVMSETSFYRHRLELKKYGIDIHLQPDSVTKMNVIPLVKVLEAEPVSTPRWAYKQGLVAC